jgi:hypothetical protein
VRLEISRLAGAGDVPGLIALFEDERVRRSPRLQQTVISQMALHPDAR